MIDVSRIMYQHLAWKSGLKKSLWLDGCKTQKIGYLLLVFAQFSHQTLLFLWRHRIEHATMTAIHSAFRKLCFPPRIFELYRSIFSERFFMLLTISPNFLFSIANRPKTSPNHIFQFEFHLETTNHTLRKGPFSYYVRFSLAFSRPPTHLCKE